MRMKVVSMVLVSLLLGAMCIGMFGIIGNVQGAPDDWIERIITDSPETVNAVAVGDADNDGNNEVVVGMDQTTNELRAYEKIGNQWVEDIIDDVGNTDVLTVAIGDADNDGFNEVVVGLVPGGAEELWAYKKDGGTWQKEGIDNQGVNVNSVAIGDADNDGKNEIIAGMDVVGDEVMSYEKDGSWSSDHAIPIGYNVYSVAIGDADNDGNNEIVLGLDSAATNFNIRAYENVSSAWEVDNISTALVNVNSVAIGDADNDGNNDVVVGLDSTAGEVRVFRKLGGSWGIHPVLLPDVDTDVNSVAVGDVDNDASNEILIGMSSTDNEVRAFEYDSGGGIWLEEIIADTPQDVLSVAIGDAYGESNMEAVIGMASTTNEVRVYALDRGELVFISHRDGDYVSGNARFEVFVTSNYVEAVTFFLGTEAIFLDTNDPYQFVLDTTVLTEGGTYTIRAEGLRDNAPSLTDTVDVVINNAVSSGDYISINTLMAEYTPDQDVTVIVNTKAPPPYDSIDLVVEYTDPSGNEMFAVEEMLPTANQYMVILHLPSDAELGPYDVTATAYAHDGDFLIWEATNTTTFTVSGKSLNDQLADLMAKLDELEDQHEALNDTINSLSDVVENEHNYTRSEILGKINDTIAMFDGFIDNITTHDTEVKAILDGLEDLVEDENNLTRTELLDELAVVLGEIGDLEEDVALEAADIKSNITEAAANIDSHLTTQDGNLGTHDDNLNTHDDNLDSAKEDAKKANEKHDTYLLVSILLLIIAIVFIIIALIFINKANKMLKETPKSEPKREALPPEEPIEQDEEIEEVINDALGDLEETTEE
ncbi:MAG: hypothetical protein JSW00_12060 [Thermoplasmata archaeon]|nr:MAG: hypothetical protein JSW00_12060 [Thermoplasmata archaeon]